MTFGQRRVDPMRLCARVHAGYPVIVTKFFVTMPRKIARANLMFNVFDFYRSGTRRIMRRDRVRHLKFAAYFENGFEIN
jgi:hypothetical protein